MSRFWQHARLGVLGILLALFVAEVGLRIAGAVLLGRQERRNSEGLGEPGTYVILAIGESTTQGGGPGNNSSYPDELQKVLDASGAGHKWKVVNLGVGGTNTREILERLPSQLERYHPQMVITMMGINDELLGLDLSRDPSLYLPYRIEEERLAHRGKGAQGAGPLVEAKEGRFDPRSLRLYKLGDWIYWSLRARFSEEPTLIVEPPAITAAREARRQAVAGHPPSRGGRALPEDNPEESLRIILAGEPHDDLSYRTAFHEPLARLGKYSVAERMHRAVIARYPKHLNAHYALANVLNMNDRLDEAVPVYRAALALDPMHCESAMELGEILLKLGRCAETEEVLEPALHRFFEDRIYSALDACYETDGKVDRRVALLLDEAAVFPESSVPHEKLARIFRKQGKLDLAAREEAATAEADSRVHPAVYYHYRALAREVRRRGIALIAMQYPVRAIAPLHRILDGVDPGIRFVENREGFLSRLDVEPYSAYFFDRSGGDFGHCTLAGNRLIAEHLAQTVLQMAP